MSVEAMTWAWSMTIGDPGAKQVLVALANFADEDGCCWPGNARLQHMTEQSERTVQRNIAYLIEERFIRREPRYIKGTGGRDRDAFFLLAPPDALARTRPPAKPAGGARLTPSVRLTPAPPSKPGASLTPPGATRDAPPRQADAPPVSTVAGHMDDPSLNHQRTFARASSERQAPPAPAGEALAEGMRGNGRADVERWWFEQQPKLQKRFGDVLYRSWFEALSVASVDARFVRLSAPTRFHADQVNASYGSDLSMMFKRSVEIVVERRD